MSYVHMVELSDNQKVQPTFLILLTGWTIWLSESSTLRKCIFGYWLGLNFLIIKKFKSSVWTFWLSESSTHVWLNFLRLNFLTTSDMMFSDIVLTFWTTFILIPKLKSCILTYWQLKLTCWHTDIMFSDIRLWWHWTWRRKCRPDHGWWRILKSPSRRDFY